VVAAGSAVLAFFAVGIGFYGQAVLLDGLVSERGWPLTRVAGATTLFFVTVGLVGPFAGSVVDRFGARTSIFAGLVMMAVGLVAAGRVETVSQLFGAYLVLGTGFAFCGAIPSNALMARWFVDFRGRATMISQTGVSLGGIVLVPFTTAMIARDGVGRATEVLAALLLTVGFAVTLWVLRSLPEGHGLEPDGRRAPAAQSAADRPAQQRLWGSGEAVRTKTFLWLALAFSGAMFSQTAFLMHALSFFRQQDAGPLAYSMLPAASIVGRLIVGGFMADRLDKRRLCIALLLIQALALCLLASATSTFTVYLAAISFGVTIGNIFMLQALLTSELFGMRSFGSVYGLLQFSSQLAAGFGPLAAGWLHTELGGYAPIWWVLAATTVASALALLPLRPPQPPSAVAQGR